MGIDRSDRTLSVRDQIDIQLEEYRALYGLVELRLGTLERRTPVHGAALAAFVAAVATLPGSLQPLVLLGLPVALVWFVRSTINHAKSLEDVLRRLERIERSVSTLAGAALIGFQSSHPSRGLAVGGRAGRGAVLSVSGMSVLLLCASLYQLCQLTTEPSLAGPYGVYVLAAAGLIVRETWVLRRYRYRPRTR